MYTTIKYDIKYVYQFLFSDDKIEPEESDSDDVTLSMKGAVLTFVGLFILGCVVGIVQVLVILHLRSKRTSKQPGERLKSFKNLCSPISGKQIVSKHVNKFTHLYIML